MPIKKWTLQYLVAFPLLATIFASVQYLKASLFPTLLNSGLHGLLYLFLYLQLAAFTILKSGSIAKYATIYKIIRPLNNRARYFS